MNSARPQRYSSSSRSQNPDTRTNPSVQYRGSSRESRPPEYFTSSISNPPPLPDDPSGIYSTLVTDRDIALSKKKYVKVTGTSEVDVEPDRINFVIQIRSIKPDIRDARVSIRKREDYILNVLKKHHIPESSYSVVELVEKVQKTDEDNNEDVLGAKTTEVGASKTKIPLQQFGAFKLTKEINVNTDNLMKYLQIFSICTEKLDEQVLISQPIVKYSPELLQMKTQLALRQAMGSSQAKARELVGNYKHHENISSGIPYLTLGSLIYASEDSIVIKNMEEYESTSSYFETFKWKRFNQRISCQITSAFEIVHAKPKKYI